MPSDAEVVEVLAEWFLGADWHKGTSANEISSEALAALRSAGYAVVKAAPRQRTPWTAREALAMAYCWSEFNHPEDREDGPEAYWLGITERARNECRKVANERLLLAAARGEAVAVLPFNALREGEMAALKVALGMKAEHRIRVILDAVQSVFRRPKPFTKDPTNAE